MTKTHSPTIAGSRANIRGFKGGDYEGRQRAARVGSAAGVLYSVTQLSWGWFVVLSLVSSLAFSLPIALLWSGKNVQRAA
jgi:hypothetical protein